MTVKVAHAAGSAVAVFLALPWLNPVATGPTATVVPWLVSLLCASIALQFLICLPRQRHAGLAVNGWLVASTTSALFGLVQYFSLSSEFSPWINVTTAGEAFANLRQRNQFASLTSIGLVALLWWVESRPRGAASSADLQTQELNSSRLALAISGPVAVATVLAAGNAASSSRTGLLQMAVLTMLVWWWGGFRLHGPRRIILASLLSYAVASIALPLLIGMEFGTGGILGRANEHAPSCASRITLWTNVLHLIAHKPWFGWGWGELDFAHFITLYPGARFCDILDNAHNLPLHLAVELGIPIALLICGSGLWLVWRAQPWCERHPTRQMAWSVLAVILLHSMLEYPLWYGPFQMAFCLCILLLWTTPTWPGANSVDEAASTTLNAPFSPFVLVVTRYSAIAMIAATAYGAWDYRRISQIYLTPAQRDEAYRNNTLAKIKNSWLFQSQVRFAELTTTELNAANAAYLNAMAHELLHFSPEPIVVEKLIDSAALLERPAEAEFFKRRFQVAFADRYEKWARNHAQP